MASTTMSTLLIGLLLVGLCAGTIFGFMGIVSTSYNAPTDSETSLFISKIQNSTLTEINATTKTLRDQSNDVGLLGRFTDIVGAFFSGGYQALKQTMGASDLMADLISLSTDKLGLGSFKNTLIAIVAVFVFLTVIIGALVKWDRL